MKKILLPLTMFASLFSIGQAVTDQVSLQSGYTNQVFYSLENGEVSNITNDDWDLAFDLGGFGIGVRVNTQLGINVYTIENDTASWLTADTAGIATATPLLNSDEDWTVGALNQDVDPSNPSDVGWGIYNTITHHIIGNKIFALQYADGSVKKLWIKSVIGGDYIFRMANLDNSDDVTQTVVKANYTGKNLVYYSAATNTVIDREPLSADWDFVFTKYTTELSPGSPYNVTGVLTNKFTETYEATGDEASNLAFNSAYPFSSEINVIGYDWKSFSFGIGAFVLADSTAFFIKTEGGDYWKLIMTEFEGTSTGNVAFTKEKIGTASIAQNEAINLSVFPNPTTGNIRINSSEMIESINIYSTSGQLVYTAKNNELQADISIQELPEGVYVLRALTADGKATTQKIVKI